MVKVYKHTNAYSIIQPVYDSRPVVIMTENAKISDVEKSLKEFSYTGRVIIDFTLCIGMKPPRLVNTYFESGSLGIYRLTNFAEVSKDTRQEICVYITENIIMNHKMNSRWIKQFRQNTGKFINDYVNC